MLGDHRVYLESDAEDASHNGFDAKAGGAIVVCRRGLHMSSWSLVWLGIMYIKYA